MNNINHTAQLSRRRFLAAAGMAAVATWLLPRRLFAEETGLVEDFRNQGPTAKITVQQLRGDVSVLMGSGGNIAVLTDPKGKLAVDSGLAGSQPQITEALAGISPAPLKVLVNTHWHFDHTDGNEWMHIAGAEITAHRNTLKHLSSATRIELLDYTFPPAPASALPTKVFDREKTIHFAGSTVLLGHYEPAHTDSDIWVYFKEADVLHAGDTIFTEGYPFIDYSTGGSINGMIRAAELTLTKVGDKTIIIPGHGPTLDKTQLAEYRDMLVSVRDKVAALKKQGKSLEEVLAAKPTEATDTKWGHAFIKADFFTKLVYTGV